MSSLPWAISDMVTVCLEIALQRFSVLYRIQKNSTKIESSRSFAEVTLTKLQCNLIENGEFNHFKEDIDREKEKVKAYIDCDKNDKANKEMIKTIKDTITNFQHNLNYEKKELEKVRQTLKHEKQETKDKNKMQLNLAISKNELRLENFAEDCLTEANEINEEILHFQRKIISEMNVHRCSGQIFKDLQIKLMGIEENIRKQYDEKKHTLIIKINMYTKKLFEIQQKTRAILTVENSFLVVINENRLYRAKLKVKEDEMQKQANVVQKIQSWWRFIIVRDNLFHKKKGKSKRKS